MISEDQESDSVQSSRGKASPVSRRLPRVTKRSPFGTNAENASDVVVAKAIVTHSEGGHPPSQKETRRLVSDLRGKKSKARQKVRGPRVDTSRGKSNCDVVRVAVKDLGWREVNELRTH